MSQFLLKLLLKQISCCAPQFPLILTAKFHSFYVKESEILESQSRNWKFELVGYFTSDSTTLVSVKFNHISSIVCWTLTRVCVVTTPVHSLHELARQSQPSGQVGHCWKLQDQPFAFSKRFGAACTL